MSNRIPISEQLASHNAALDYRNDNGTLVLPKNVEVVKNGELIVNGEIPVQVLDYIRYTNVNIMWEDAGYPDYRDLGLYGYYSTSYVQMSYHNDELIIKPTDNNIEIVIK
ncbi:TPA: hypothetical protein ACGPA7_002115 [Streptococcus suis]